MPTAIARPTTGPTFVGGLAAPAFLFLAGLGTALSGASKLRAGAARSQVTLRAGAPRVDRLLAWRSCSGLSRCALGLGRADRLPRRSDILNVMGPALVVGRRRLGRRREHRRRVVAASAATVGLAMSPRRSSAPPPGSTPLPAPLQWYSAADARPHQLHAGPVERVRLRRRRRRGGAGQRPHRRATSAACSCALARARGRRPASAAYWASFQPTIYPAGRSSFWARFAAPFFLPAPGDVSSPCCRSAWSLRASVPEADRARRWPTLGGGVAVRLLGARRAGLRRHRRPDQAPPPGRAHDCLDRRRRLRPGPAGAVDAALGGGPRPAADSAPQAALVARLL